MEKKNNNTNFLIGLFIGGLIGAGATFLMGTQKGKKTIEKLKKAIENYLNNIEKKVDKNKDEFFKKAQEVKKDTIVNTNIIKNKVKEQVKKLQNDLTPKSRIEEVQEKGRLIAEEIGKNFFTKQGKSTN